jgi:hypothetical protein
MRFKPNMGLASLDFPTYSTNKIRNKQVCVSATFRSCIRPVLRITTGIPAILTKVFRLFSSVPPGIYRDYTPIIPQPLSSKSVPFYQLSYHSTICSPYADSVVK